MMRRFALIIFLVTAVGCASESEEPVSEEEARALIGRWTADDTTHFEFYAGGEALWIFEGRNEDTFRIQYDYDPATQPRHLDLTGFDRGFLRGRTLYCIVAFDSVSAFRMDCEPGAPTESGARPDTFTQKTMTYRAASDSI